jgi:hypothetical protein
MEHSSIKCCAWLRKLMPFAKRESLQSWAQLPLNPITVVVTTHSKAEDGERKRAKCRDIYAAPFFNLKFAHAATDYIPGIDEKEAFAYPKRFAGSLFKIRRHIEETFFLDGGFLVISDDDPGTTRNSKYTPQGPRGIYPFTHNITKSGAHISKISSEQLAVLWHGAFHFGRKNGSAYVGLNASTQQLMALPGYATTGACPNLSFGTYGFRPIRTNVVITQAAGVLRPFRAEIPTELYGVQQEWATVSVKAIFEGPGTLMVMPVQTTFAVKPPRDANADLEAIRKTFPGIVNEGKTTAGGTTNKTGCIVRLKNEVTGYLEI